MSLSLYVNVFGHVRGGLGCARSVSHCGVWCVQGSLERSSRRFILAEALSTRTVRLVG